MSNCSCFTCTHEDPKLKKAYCIGYIEACKWFLGWAESQKIKMGSISDDDLGGIYAQIKCNHDETCCYADSLPECDDELTDEMQDMYIFSMRYCLGRQSIGVSTCIDEITRKAKKLSPRVLFVMMRDIVEFFHKVDNYFPQDIKNSWMELKDYLTKLYKEKTGTKD